MVFLSLLNNFRASNFEIAYQISLKLLGKIYTRDFYWITYKLCLRKNNWSLLSKINLVQINSYTFLNSKFGLNDFLNKYDHNLFNNLDSIKGNFIKLNLSLLEDQDILSNKEKVEQILNISICFPSYFSEEWWLGLYLNC